MTPMQLCALLAAGEADIVPGQWEMVQKEQEEILRIIREDMPVEEVQLFADHVFWAARATELIDKGLVTGPEISVAGAERVVEAARARGLVVPKADVVEALFKST